MKKGTMNSRATGAVTSIAPVLAIAALLFLILAAGCTTSTPAPAPVTTPPVTTVPTTVATPTTVPTPSTEQLNAIADKAFADAADACFNSTPVITDLLTRQGFATCIKDIPLPPGNCAQNYRYYLLKYTNEDFSTAGYARETANNLLAREAYLRGEGYDGVGQEYAPCGNSTLIPTSFYQ
jgi:hypothetical protein